MELKNNFFLNEYRSRAMHKFDGYVGYEDFENALYNGNWNPIEFPDYYKNSTFSRFKRIFSAFIAFINIPKKSTIIFIFPECSKIERFFIELMLWKKDITLICAILDIDGQRTNDPHLLKKEIKRLKRFSNFIIFHDVFENWFTKHIKNAKFSYLNFFDFYTKDTSHVDRSLSNTIVFAGNLAPQKSHFLNNLNKIENCYFNIYGPSATIKEWPKNTKYCGIFSANDISKHLIGSFGLLWDGDSVDSLKGPYGEYNKINSPHKLSLYVVSGLPIIASKEAGVASLIIKFNIGYLVSSLTEIPSMIASINDYEEKRKSLQILAKKITTGFFTLASINEIQAK